MYTDAEREGILREFHRSGMTVKRACRELPSFPDRHTLTNWLLAEEAGAAPGGRRRMGAHAAGGGGGRPGMGGIDRQTDWRDWGADLPGDPAERARMAEVKLAEALAVLDVLKAPGPGSLTSEEKFLAGQAAREACPLVRLADVCETLSIPKSTYEDQRARVGRADPKAALRLRVRAVYVN